MTLYFRSIKFIFPVLFLTLNFIFNFAEAYSIGNPADSFNNSAKSLFKKNLLLLSPIDVTKFVKSDPHGLSFSDLINTEGFSSNDIGSSVKAVLTLFIRLTITTLNVALGILRVLLDVLTNFKA